MKETNLKLKFPFRQEWMLLDYLRRNVIWFLGGKENDYPFFWRMIDPKAYTKGADSPDLKANDEKSG